MQPPRGGWCFSLLDAAATHLDAPHVSWRIIFAEISPQTYSEFRPDESSDADATYLTFVATMMTSAAIFTTRAALPRVRRGCCARRGTQRRIVTSAAVATSSSRDQYSKLCERLKVSNHCDASVRPCMGRALTWRTETWIAEIPPMGGVLLWQEISTLNGTGIAWEVGRVAGVMPGVLASASAPTGIWLGFRCAQCLGGSVAGVGRLLTDFPLARIGRHLWFAGMGPASDDALRGEWRPQRAVDPSSRHLLREGTSTGARSSCPLPAFVDGESTETSR